MTVPSTTLSPRALVGLEHPKSYLKIEDESKNGILIRLINASTVAIESHCKRRFKAEDYTEKHYGKRQNIFVRQYPIISIASIKDNGTDLAEETDYYNHENYVELLSESQGPVEISYRAGYEVIPDDLAQACTIMVQFYYKGDVANFSETFDGTMTVRPLKIPPHVQWLLKEGGYIKKVV